MTWRWSEWLENHLIQKDCLTFIPEVVWGSLVSWHIQESSVSNAGEAASMSALFHSNYSCKSAPQKTTSGIFRVLPDEINP